MSDKNFDPWKRVREFWPEALLQESSDLVQWPIKLYKAPKLSPYYHHGHLLIAADCSAFSYPGFHDALSKGRIPLICCPENDFDITVKLADIFSLNDIASVTIGHHGQAMLRRSQGYGAARRESKPPAHSRADHKFICRC